jgi:hypothetical protein
MTVPRSQGLLVGLTILLLCPGCRNSDLVEAELRSRDRELRHLRGELTSAEWENQALTHVLQGIRQGSPISPELASQIYTIRQITLGRQTGGYDRDDKHGDDALQVVVEPRDCDGHVLKAPGALHVEAMEINAEGVKLPLSAWDLGPEEVRRSWRSGLLTTGYVAILPWQKWPSFEKVRVVVRFILADGRLFEADKDIRVRLLPAAARQLPTVTEPLGPAVPGTPRPLPAPQKIEPAPSPKNQAWWLPAGNDGKTIQASLITEPDEEEPSLADAVKLLKPVPLSSEPGEPD